MSRHRLQLDITRQPDDTTCGPTCLAAVYRFFGDEIGVDQVITEVRALAEGGTLAVLLACHALGRGYRAALYTYNLQIFDPTWFGLDRTSLAARLREQARYRQDGRLRFGSEAYLEFLERGGELRFTDLSRRLIRRLLDDDLPLLTGLSSTYLYREAREIAATGVSDDVRGVPAGHFVVLSGYEERARRVLVADPLHPNPLTVSGSYAVDVDRLIAAVLLGVLTYDANLLQLTPGRRAGSGAQRAQ